MRAQLARKYKIGLFNCLPNPDFLNRDAQKIIICQIDYFLGEVRA